MTAVDGRPRPQLWRTHAESLDGVWDYSADPTGSWFGPDDVKWAGSIVVPFAPGTPASGVTESDPGLAWWYRRTASFAGGPDEQQVLHFGAIDNRADVWVDGHHVATHEGGYTPLRVRLRGPMASAGDHEIVVRALDDPFDLSMHRGKQSWELESRFVWYPRTSGIWQPTWTERLGARSIDSLSWRADVPNSALGLRARVHGDVTGCRLRVVLQAHGRTLADDEWMLQGPTVERQIVVDRGAGDLGGEDLLWSPRRPVLIDAVVQLLGPDREVIDEAESYAGLRSVSVDGNHLLLNGHPIRHRLVLDQGYWPESGLTAPSDDALRRDVELTKQLGFNGVRKHQKVEDPRYLYWADRLGLLVWAEMPSAYRFDDTAVQRAMKLWPEVVLRDRSHPCIVGWVPFNESWGVREIAHRPDEQAYVRSIVEATRALDPGTPVVGNDGWESVNSDVIAVHDYDLQPERFGARWRDGVDDVVAGYGTSGFRVVLDDTSPDRPVVLSEFGGVAFGEHGWGYEKSDSQEAFVELFEALMREVRSATRLAGFCYTQLTDTYQETNGLLTADREPKAPLERLRAAVRGRDDAAAPWTAAETTSAEQIAEQKAQAAP